VNRFNQLVAVDRFYTKSFVPAGEFYKLGCGAIQASCSDNWMRIVESTKCGSGSRVLGLMAWDGTLSVEDFERAALHLVKTWGHCCPELPQWTWQKMALSAIPGRVSRQYSFFGIASFSEMVLKIVFVWEIFRIQAN